MTKEILENTSILKIENLRLPENFPFPYTPERFTVTEKAILSKHFTNYDKPVFAIYGLPQEVVGAMFSRYSRTEKSVRRVFLDEFWGSSELGIQNIAENIAETEGVGIETAQEKAGKFYKRVFAEYGDDSVIQMGSVHISFEYVSQIAAKAIEDGRIAAAYIEKSTRYVDFGSRVGEHYLFMEEPSIMNSEFADEYLEWNNSLFEAYQKHIPTTKEMLKRKYPLEEQVFTNPTTGEEVRYSQISDKNESVKAQKAYERALKAKTFDTIRVFLPTTTVTNLGAHFSGQAAENSVNKLLTSPYPEVRLLGAMAYNELVKVAPSFLQNVDHVHGAKTREYMGDLREVKEREAGVISQQIHEKKRGNKVRLVDWDEDADVKIAAQLIYTGQKDRGLSKKEIFDWVKRVKDEDRIKYPDLAYSPRLAEIIVNSVPDRSSEGLNRRHKLPRAFEHVDTEVEFYTDFGIFRDLQRNRMSSTERQMLTGEELFIPNEFHEVGMEEVVAEYLKLGQKTRELNARVISKGGDLENASEYVTMFGTRLRYNIRANIRQWVFFPELRTIEGGHPTYRRAMQSAAKQILLVYPFLQPLFTHVNWKRDYGLGRLKAEVKTQQKLEEVS